MPGSLVDVNAGITGPVNFTRSPCAERGRQTVFKDEVLKPEFQVVEKPGNTMSIPIPLQPHPPFQKPSNWLVGFEDRYSQARRDREELAARRHLKKKNQDFDPYNEFAVRALDERRLLKERLEYGYQLKWEREIAGRVRQPFTETGLRSEDSTLLKLFVSRVPKGGRARASDDKSTLYVPYRSKLLTLDCAYIEANKVVLSAIRLDCDGVFASPEAFEDACQALVDEAAIPHLPHLAVGDLMPDGTYRNPHLIIMLPAGAEVWNNLEDKRCRTHPLKLFDAVSRGWMKAMLPIGIDPGAPRATQRMKNPVSPIWHTIVMNDSQFMTLKEYATCLDTKVKMEALVRHAASIQSEMGITASNRLFNVMKDRADVLLREWHFNADPRIAGSRSLLADHLHAELERYAAETGLTDIQVGYVIGKVVGYRADHFEPSRIQGAKKDRHRLMHVVAEVEGVADRQRIGAAHSAEVRKAAALEKLVKVYAKVLDEGKTVSVERLATMAGVSRAVAYRSLETCKQICLSRCRVKKVETSPPEVELADTLHAEVAFTAPTAHHPSATRVSTHTWTTM